MTRSNAPEAFLTDDERTAVEMRIAAAEQLTSAEIKVVLVRRCWLGIERRARQIFRKLGLDATEHRNCVLILLATRDREFLIHGDAGVDARIGPGYWDEVRDAMAREFRADRFGDGLGIGVQMLGTRLAALFPRRDGDADEIGNAIVFEP